MVVAVVVDTPEHRLIALLCFPFLLPHPPLSLLRSFLLIVILSLISTGTVTSNHAIGTNFWGPVANWGLPIAAISDIRKDPEMISGVMSPTMAGYS